jgi:serine/threonine protein kinase/Tfp pilus assembly protein PilF
MTAESYRRAKELFHAACALSPEERRAFLERACAGEDELRRELERLLRADGHAVHPIDTPAIEGGLGVSRQGLLELLGLEPAMPERIGPYRVRRKLGEGGMAVVWEAQQQNPQRPVALKVIRPGMLTRRALRRFQYEAQVLGRLQHPGIAQIYESGADESEYGPLPYLVMELIEGQSLTEYAEARGLDVRQRVKLMLKVCEAVQHAHARGLLHRDLKPRNILVTPEGQPKVLDFGVARALNRDPEHTTLETEAGLLIGTLAYMSPEQLEGDAAKVDSRADVYALGATLYELLAGQSPIEVRELSLAEAVRVIREVDPPALGAVNRACRGDLTTIVAKALEKEPARRYQTVSQLAEDLRRYLDRQPILAHPPSTVYHVRKLLSRHKAVAALAAVALLALLGGSAGMTVLYFRAARESQTARRTAEFLEKTFRLMHTDQGSPLVPIGKVLDDAAARIDRELDQRPEVVYGLRRMVAGGYYSLERYKESLEQFEKACAAALKVHGRLHADVAFLYKLIGDVHYTLGRYDQAQRSYGEALDIYRRVLGPRHPDSAEVLGQLGVMAMQRGDLTTAEQMLEEASAVFQRHYGADDPATAMAKTQQARLRMEQGRLDEAADLASSAVTVLRAHPNPGGNRLTQAINVLAAVRIAQGQRAEGIRLQREVLDIYRRKFGPDSAWVARQTLALASTLMDAGQTAEAESLLREVLARTDDDAPRRPPELPAAAAALGELLARRGAYAEAEAVARQGLRDYEAAGLADQDLHGYLLNVLGSALLREEKFEEAEGRLLQACSILSSVFRPEHPRVQTALRNLVDLYETWGKPEQAATFRARVLDSSATTDHRPAAP